MREFKNEKVQAIFKEITSEEVESTIHELEQSFIVAQVQQGEFNSLNLANTLDTTYQIRRILIEIIKERDAVEK